MWKRRSRKWREYTRSSSETLLNARLRGKAIHRELLSCLMRGGVSWSCLYLEKSFQQPQWCLGWKWQRDVRQEDQWEDDCHGYGEREPCFE